MLIATKTVPPERIRVAIEHGCFLRAENRVQEVIGKADALRDLTSEQHFIGHLQTNKINHLLRHVTTIQSVDSFRLAEAINKRTEAPIDVFLQVNTSREESKFGVSPEKAIALLNQMRELENLRVKGLMTIGKLFATGETARRCFELLARIQEMAQDAGHEEVRELSMGMTPDFVEAIAEGATIVRIGTAIFGKRPTPEGFFWREMDRP